MNFIIELLEKFFSIQLTANMKLYDLLAMIFKYAFVIIIYSFIFNIIKMIYLDIKGINNLNTPADSYLKLINRKERLPFKIQEHYFIKNSTTIGRADNNDIVLGDRFISKNHARIFKQRGQFYLEDLGSANGSYVNGQKVSNVVLLKDKDLVDFGQVEFLFVDGDDSDEK
ncbi:FHA domain-containing protein [Lagierella massiliensis]|uniref:FHA domain-containing protein n=1 Tax=Lagierella massiliensis TaxID=1689303 RepID=UPI0006D8562E|nr:FHA domain-containing protein [Lagierella massiliensis]